MADHKTLTDALPAWRDSHIPGRLTAAWPVIDSEGVAREGTGLVFVCKADDVTRISASLLLRGNRIFGVDIVPGNECKMNGPGAKRLNLPSQVCGPHFHIWADNRDAALESGLGHMPHRRPTPRLLVRLPHALAAMCQEVNLTLTAQQASFDVPPLGLLPLGG